MEQQFKDLLLELNHDTQDKSFNCQEEGKTLTEEYVLSSSSKSNIWFLPLTINTQQTLDYQKTVSPPPLKIDFLLDSGATLNVLNDDGWKGTYKKNLF